MSTQQYLRKYSLLVYSKDGGEVLDMSSLRFTFVIRRGDWQTPNSADIRVYNIALDTANRVHTITPQPEFSRVVVQAGYEGNFGVVFDGQIKQVRRGRESQVDTYLDITGADGDSAYNFSTIAISLAAGETAPDNAVQHVIQEMSKYSVEQGHIPAMSTNPLPRGKVLYGMCKDEMRKISRNSQSVWSIQDGKVQMVPMSAYIDGDIPLVTSATGMIGLPEQTQNGIQVRTLLNPNLKIGQAIKLDNESIQKYRYSLGFYQQVENGINANFIKTNDDGLYYVMAANHSGDTRGQGWYTDLTCLAIDASIKPSFRANNTLTEMTTTEAIKRN
jgi:hypothetical protein